MTFESFIPPRAKSVLELTGEVDKNFETSGERFLAIQPECKYTVEKYLPDAKGTFDAVVVQSNLIDNMEVKELTELIKKISGKLNKGGKIIFGLDNVAFIGNIVSVLEGNAPTINATLTVEELKKAIADAKLNIAGELNAAKKISVPKALADLAKTDIATFLYIITAIPEKLPKSLMIQTMLGEEVVCAPHRVHIPNRFMITVPNVATTTIPLNQPFHMFNKDEYDRRIFINQRMSFGTFKQGADFFETAVKRGYLYLSEMDDNPNLWPDDYAKSANVNFIGVHAIQTSTKYLADILKEFNPHVKVFPNQLFHLLPERDYAEEAKNKKNPIVIFFGALNRDDDFEEILPVINKLSKEYGKKIAFNIISRTKLFDSIESENKNRVFDANKYEGQFVSYALYEKTIHNSDIALLPLRDTEFNRAKSDLKFIECAGAGAAVLASPVIYSDVVKDGENGFIYNNLQEFEEKLRLLIDNKEKRIDIAKNAYEYVKHNRLMAQHYEERLDWYEELLKKLPELTKETRERLSKVEVPPEVSSEGEGNSDSGAEIIIPE